MEIIELETPWCFNTESITEGEVQELATHFVKEGVNYKYPWSNADSEQIYVGINNNNCSDYNCDISDFDEENDDANNVTVYTVEELREIIAKHKEPQLEEGVVYYVEDLNDSDWAWLAIHNIAYVNIHQKRLSTAGESWLSEFNTKDRYKFTKAAPSQIKHYEACVKAGKYVEPEEEFVVGKWYKVLTTTVSHYLKFTEIDSEKAYLDPEGYIANCERWSQGDSIDLDRIKEKTLLEDLTEIQHLLPEGHEDRAPKPTRSERYLTTMKFFEQLREPERSEAITNYDEEFSETVPINLFEAVNSAFQWDCCNQEDQYWLSISNDIEGNTYFKKPELLVFGKYKVGDVVVTERGYIDTVSSSSTKHRMTLTECGVYTARELLRPATPEEVEAYNQGVRNISDIKPKVEKEAVHCTTQEEWDYVLGKLNPRLLADYGFKHHKEYSYISLKDGTYGNIGSSTRHDYAILTFQQWCDKYSNEGLTTKVTKPAKGMHVRCLKPNSWADGQTKVGQVFEIESVDWDDDLWVNGSSFGKNRLRYGDFELLTDYKEETYVAKVGDWVYVLDKTTSMLKTGGVYKCIARMEDDDCQFNHKGATWLSPKHYRKATRAEIDSITKTTEGLGLPMIEPSKPLETQWTADNWYVEVTSQEEANEVIESAAKMYGKSVDTCYSYNEEYSVVSLERGIRYRIEPKWFVENKRKPRPISDFIPVKQETWTEQKARELAQQWNQNIVEAVMAGEYVHKMQELTIQGAQNLDKLYSQTQQDELVIYKPKRLIL